MAKARGKSIQERVSQLLKECFSKKFKIFFDTRMMTKFESQGTERAVNRFDKNQEEVKATSWFGNYWCFIRINFCEDDEKNVRIFASISFFEKVGENLKQMFRAEWDNYPQKDGYNHPQPHWHFTEQLNNNEKSFSDLENEKDDSIFSGLQEQDNFSVQQKQDNKDIYLHRMHFAMCGNWANNGKMVNEAKDEKLLVDWMIYLFQHIEKELTYKDGKNY